MATPTQITEYATQVLTVRMGVGGKQAVITFTPHGHAPVCIHLPRAALDRFLTQASLALAESPLDGSV
jgi:hypothetical protein